ncbi:hypothetical protein B0O80DRAFT_534669, partial [Mortierella sp. GBAus27b]
MNDLRLFCILEGESTPFPVTIDSDKTVGDLKDAIKTKKSNYLASIDADQLTLWKVSIQINDNDETPILLDNVSDKKKLGPSADLSDVFEEKPPKKRIHILVQRPPSAMASNKRKWLSSEADGRAIRPRLATKPYDRRKASLVFNEQDFEGFPLNDKSSFELIRANSRYAYFDRTRYISVVDSSLENVLLFLRPRRFGKSLFLSTLAYFHGVENKQNYKALFESLDVDRDVKSGKVRPGQYLTLTFDFSKVNRSRDIETAEAGLNDMINNSIRAFYTKYAPYLGTATSHQLIEARVAPRAVSSLTLCVELVEEALNAVSEKDDPLYDVKGIYLLADEYDAFSNEFLNTDDQTPWDQLRINNNSLLKGFWAAVKSMLGPRTIVKCFITGVSPLSMSDHTSGFNVATYVSWDEELSSLCGLTEEDVLAALEQCGPNIDVQGHLETMKTHYNGYNFVEVGGASCVFNTNTCLEYLQNLIYGKHIDPVEVPNSEVSEPTLEILAASPVAKDIISGSCTTQTSGYPLILYENLKQSFRLTDLWSDIEDSKPAWLSYMIHIGGLTFCVDNTQERKQLRLPNRVAATRFGDAVLKRHGLRLKDVHLAFQNIVNTGNIRQALSLYRQMICMRDVHSNDFMKTEEQHRDSFYFAFLGNCHPSLRRLKIEAKITKVRDFDRNAHLDVCKCILLFTAIDDARAYRHANYG